MRPVVLFIAMSLDGYIADEYGKVDWLSGQDDSVETPDTYAEFAAYIDTVVMGWRTYAQIVGELSPDKWVYAGLKSYVLTHREMPPAKEIIFTAQDASQLVNDLRKEAGQAIWICGGASVVQQLMKDDAIDIYYISVIPTLLGKGIPLFATGEQTIPLRLLKTKAYNGIVDLIYARR